MSAPKLLQYQNGERNSANGVELELGGKVFEKRSAVGGIQAALGISSSQIRIVDLAEARSGLAAGAGLATPATRVIIAVGSRRCKLWRASSPQFR